MVQQPETQLPQEIAAVLELQSPSGQWRLSNRLFEALGHTAFSIPSPPDGVQDGRWATALAITFLRRRPDIIDLTYHAYSRAIAWVDESLLAQAHKRLPPADLYYLVDEEASRQGRWQEQTQEVLEECGHAYFLPPTPAGSEVGESGESCGVGGGVGGGGCPSGDGSINDDGANCALSRSVLAAFGSTEWSHAVSAAQGAPDEYTLPPSATAPSLHASGRGKRTRTGLRRLSTSRDVPRARVVGSRRKAAAAASAEQSVLQQQSKGLHLEVNRAMWAARKTFKIGDRVESRWRRPTRLDKPRLDPHAWHQGVVVQSQSNGDRVDVVFEDGDCERLSGIPLKHVRLCHSSSALSPPLLDNSGVEGESKITKAGAENSDDSSCTSTPTPTPIDWLSPASRRELAHVASASYSLRRTWENPMPFNQELARLRMLKKERRGKPRWRESFPLISFEAAKRLPLGASGTGAGPGLGPERAVAATEAAPNNRRGRYQAQGIAPCGARTRTRRSATAISPAKPQAATVQDKRAGDGLEQRQKQDCVREVVGNETKTSGTKSAAGPPGAESCSRSSALSPSLSPRAALITSQAKLVVAAIAYDKCVAGVRDCLDRGAAAFRVARTYSDQQRAFEESTAMLGPSQPARAGYTDWRGRGVVALQNATLDVVEAMDSWAAEWAAARGGETGGGQALGVGRQDGGENNNRAAAAGAKELLQDAVEPTATKAPPFLWEGSPLVSTIIGHSAALMAVVPELREWYGPGFPIERNPFFLAYPLDDRPVTPRNALVRALVNGEMVTTVSRTLLEERGKEEQALKAITAKQASAPSWWPSSQGGLGGEAHYGRIRRAEKIIAREELRVVQGEEYVRWRSGRARGISSK